MNQYTASPTPPPATNSQPHSIDLRSDTVTQPGWAMKQAMLAAPLGDDVYGEDPSVNALQTRLARLLGKEAALFFPSGTQSNLAALLSHCQRGEEVLVGDKYHTFVYEARGASVLGGISLQPLTTDHCGGLSVDTMLAAIKADDIHLPITRLLALENTVNGCVQSQENIDQLAAAAHAAGLKVHLDGARLFNAAIQQNKPVAELVAALDSVSICLSKGLGTPAGSVLAGDAALIHYARRQRKMLGGGMRQSGMLAAAGLYALEHNLTRLADDHAHVQTISSALAALPGVEIDQARLQTNMFFLKVAPADYAPLLAFMHANRVIISGQQPWMRCVVHLDITPADVERLISLFQQFYLR